MNIKAGAAHGVELPSLFRNNNNLNTSSSRQSLNVSHDKYVESGSMDLIASSPNRSIQSRNDLNLKKLS